MRQVRRNQNRSDFKNQKVKKHQNHPVGVLARKSFVVDFTFARLVPFSRVFDLCDHQLSFSCCLSPIQEQSDAALVLAR